MAKTRRYIGTITVFAYSDKVDAYEAKRDAIDQLRALADHINETIDCEPQASLEAFHRLDYGSIHAEEYHLETLEKIEKDGK